MLSTYLEMPNTVEPLKKGRIQSIDTLDTMKMNDTKFVPLAITQHLFDYVLDIVTITEIANHNHTILVPF